MSESLYHVWAARVARLTRAVAELEPFAEEMKLEPARERSWHGPLFQHLQPQLAESQPVLRVAVTGGTNTGKSTVFNHLVGSAVSRMERFATKTKHPVCVLPVGSTHGERLGELFPDFIVRPWESENDAALDCQEDLLIMRTDPSGQQSPRLILLDTPDIDGVLRENWRRAIRIRNAADVVIVTLTEQKYNDDAVVRFFREAAKSDKTFILVFNFLDWPADRELCLGWLRDFERETAAKADFVYVLPRDREAAAELRLPFHPVSPGATDLRRDLAELQFGHIKLRSLRGSLRHVLDRTEGLPQFLHELQLRAGEYLRARDTLREEVCARGIDLPQPPGHLVWGPLWDWFESRRTRFDRWVHDFYNRVGQLVTKPFRRSEEELEQDFTKLEWESFSLAVQQILDKLRLLQREGSEIVKTAVQQVLGGVQQEKLFEQLRARHRNLPLLTEAYREFVGREMDQFERDHPKLLKLVRHGLIATAVIRPAITIGLLALPGSQALAYASGHAAVHAAHEVVTQAAINVGTDTAIAASIQVAVEGGGELSIRALLSRLFSGFFQQRNQQLLQLLNELIADPVIGRIHRLAGVVDGDAMTTAWQVVREFETTSFNAQPEAPAFVAETPAPPAEKPAPAAGR